MRSRRFGPKQELVGEASGGELRFDIALAADGAAA